MTSEEIEALETAAYAEGRTDEAETSKEALASKLIDAWVESHRQPIPWAKAVAIVAITTKMDDEERDRLLNLE